MSHIYEGASSSSRGIPILNKTLNATRDLAIRRHTTPIHSPNPPPTTTMFPTHIILLFIGCFLLAQPLALPLTTGNTPEIRALPLIIFATTNSLNTRALLIDPIRHRKRDCNGANGGDGGSASGAGARAGDGGNGGTCTENGGKGLSAGEIAGIVVGALAGVCTIVGGGYKFVKWMKKK